MIITDKRQVNVWWKILFIGVMSFILIAGCGGGGSGDGGGSNDTGDISDNTAVTYLSGNDMLIVLDTYGNPIANAMVGESDVTDGNGVAVGEFADTAEGWLRVAAPGYASGYADSVENGGIRVFELRLTPTANSVNLASGEIKTLSVGDATDPAYSTTLNASDFITEPVTVSLTPIDPIHVASLFAPISTGEKLNLQKAFAIEAENSELERVVLKNGSTITIRVRDEGTLLDDAILAYFNPETGQWEVVAGGCTRDGLNHFNCTVTVLSPLYGFFDAQDAGYLTSAFQIAADATDDLGDAWSKANQSVKDRLRDLAACMAAGTCDPTQDPEMVAAVNAMAQAASDYAAANQNEKGKMALLGAQYRANLLGFNEIADTLSTEVTAITNKLGQEYVNNGNCGRIKEMLHIERQFELLGGDSEILSQLQQKLEDYFQTCDLWVGTIVYRYYIGPGDPCNGDLTGGMGVWTETHHVRMPTHVRTCAVTGEDKTSLNFQEVKFSADDECEHSKTYYGSPDVTDLFLDFDGTYDGITFSVNTPGPASNPIDIVQDYMLKAKENDECITVIAPGPISFPGFSSALVHGFSESPPVTLQEMLETGEKGTWGEMDTIRGREAFSNACEETNLGRYPFDNGDVYWFFWHERKVLPVAE